ncbi:hypothetical protein BS50DRAFT_580465 [Corynespora cassiicola Philippines]|uniref:Uncharacterized protein n=1 Tax=Corynespora cassiicola Philippines TaxID=1448308 RepID=A0A2T2N031_CORCC|nr:hypothetical protein BS50DRAFT_580465 [Corynespora cassiicola Philippines]
MATTATTARHMSVHAQAVSHQGSDMINAVGRKMPDCHLRRKAIKSTCSPRHDW